MLCMNAPNTSNIRIALSHGLIFLVFGQHAVNLHKLLKNWKQHCALHLTLKYVILGSLHPTVIRSGIYYAGTSSSYTPDRFLWIVPFWKNHQPASLLCGLAKQVRATETICNAMGCFACLSQEASPHETAGFSPSGRKTEGLGSVRGGHDASIRRTGTYQRHIFFFAPLTGQLRASGTAENLRVGAVVRSTAIM